MILKPCYWYIVANSPPPPNSWVTPANERYHPQAAITCRRTCKQRYSHPSDLRLLNWLKIICSLVYFYFIIPLPVKPGGTIGFLAVCHSVTLSVRLSVSQSTRCPSTRFSELFSVVLWDIDLKFGIWICLDIIQIKFDFGHVCSTFTWVIALCKNFVFRTFLCHPLTYWVEISYMNLSSHNTGQVRLWLCLTYFYMSYCPLLKFCFPDFSLSSFDILTSNFIYGFVLT